MLKKDPSVIKYASLRLQEDPSMQLLMNESSLVLDKVVAISNIKGCRKVFNNNGMELENQAGKNTLK